MLSRFNSLFLMVLCSLGCFSPLHSVLNKNAAASPPAYQSKPPAQSPPASYSSLPEPVPTLATPKEEIDHKQILALIENLITAIQANQIQKAYSEYTSEPFKKVTSVQEFEYFVNAYPELAKNKNALFGNIEQKSKGVFSIQGTLISTSGDSIQMEYNLIRENGLWKIIGIKILPAVEKPIINTPEKKELPPVPTNQSVPLDSFPSVEFINK